MRCSSPWCWRSRIAPGTSHWSARSRRSSAGCSGTRSAISCGRRSGPKVIAFYHLESQFAAYTQAFNEWGLWIILIKGLTPIPYKLVTIASGVAKFDLLVFVLASIVTRGLRFFMVAALLRWVGEPIREFIEKYLTWVTTAFVVLLVGGFVALKYI